MAVPAIRAGQGRTGPGRTGPGRAGSDWAEPGRAGPDGRLGQTAGRRGGLRESESPSVGPSRAAAGPARCSTEPRGPRRRQSLSGGGPRRVSAAAAAALRRQRPGATAAGRLGRLGQGTVRVGLGYGGRAGRARPRESDESDGRACSVGLSPRSSESVSRPGGPPLLRLNCTYRSAGPAPSHGPPHQSASAGPAPCA
jgi:hypothetical protein